MWTQAYLYLQNQRYDYLEKYTQNTHLIPAQVAVEIWELAEVNFKTFCIKLKMVLLILAFQLSSHKNLKKLFF